MITRKWGPPAPEQGTRLNHLSISLRILAVLLLLSVGLSLANDPRPTVAGGQGGWRGAPRHSAGIAPDPARFADTAIVQVYAAATYGWRGYFAVHPWIIYKRAGETAYTRYDVIGWGVATWCGATTRCLTGCGSGPCRACWWSIVARAWRR